MRHEEQPLIADDGQGVTAAHIAACVGAGAALGSGLWAAGLLPLSWSAFAAAAVAGWSLAVVCALTGRRLVKALEINRRELVHLADTAPVLLWSLAPNGKPVFANRRLGEWLGVPEAQILDEPRDRLAAYLCSGIHPADAERVDDALAATLSHGAPFALQYRQRRLDGSYRWLDSVMEPLYGSAGAVHRWYGAARDVEDELQQREDLRVSRRRMAKAGEAATLSELAASLAHELNQPLGALQAEAGACRRWLAATPPDTARALVVAGRISELAEAAGEIVRSTADLFRADRAERRPTVINTVIHDAGRLLADELHAHCISLDLSLDPAGGEIQANATQIQQLLVNLMRNGIEAMGDAPQQPRALSVRSKIDGAAIRIDVIDRGGGVVDPARLFEPFFTTKEGGMGMGLAICRSIVRDHEGRLWLDRSDADGTCFSVTLPLASDDGDERHET